MYKSLTKTNKKYSELEAHKTLKRVASVNAIIKHYKSSLISFKRYFSHPEKSILNLSLP